MCTHLPILLSPVRHTFCGLLGNPPYPHRVPSEAFCSRLSATSCCAIHFRNAGLLFVGALYISHSVRSCISGRQFDVFLPERRRKPREALQSRRRCIRVLWPNLHLLEQWTLSSRAGSTTVLCIQVLPQRMYRPNFQLISMSAVLPRM
jgi:hypothetical protein